MMTVALAVCAAALTAFGGGCAAAWLVDDDDGATFGGLALVMLVSAITIAFRVVMDIAG